MTQQASFVSVVDTALDRYIARAPLYLGTAAVVAVVGSAAIVFGRLGLLEGIVVTLALIAPLHGIVALGTSREAADEQLSAAEIISRILRKWPELFACQIITNLVGTMAIFSLLSNDLTSVLALIPLSIGWGALSLADVAIALDEPEPASNIFSAIVHRLRVLGAALRTSLGYAFRLQTFNRMASLAIIQVPCVLLQQLIHTQTAAHHIVVDDMLVTLWLSCLIDGILEAIFTLTLQRLRSA